MGDLSQNHAVVSSMNVKPNPTSSCALRLMAAFTTTTLPAQEFRKSCTALPPHPDAASLNTETRTPTSMVKNTTATRMTLPPSKSWTAPLPSLLMLSKSRPPPLPPLRQRLLPLLSKSFVFREDQSSNLMLG